MTTDYGRDTWCASSRKPGRLVSGTMNVALALFRRMITPNGMLRYDPLYGYDLASELGRTVDASDEARIRARLSGQLELDERVASTAVRIESTKTGVLVSYRVHVDVYLKAGGSFTLVVAVSGVSVELLKVVPS